MEVEVLYEEPTPRVLAEYRVWADGQPGTPEEVMTRHTALRLDELAAALRFELDGVPVVAERLPVAGRNGAGGADFIRYRLHLRVAAEPGWRQLSILDQAHPGEALASRWDLALAPSLRLDASSFWLDGRDHTGQWVTETPQLACRELRLGLTPRTGLSRLALQAGEWVLGPRPRDDRGLVESRWAKVEATAGLLRAGWGILGLPAGLFGVLGILAFRRRKRS